MTLEKSLTEKALDQLWESSHLLGLAHARLKIDGNTQATKLNAAISVINEIIEDIEEGDK